LHILAWFNKSSCFLVDPDGLNHIIRFVAFESHVLPRGNKWSNRIASIAEIISSFNHCDIEFVPSALRTCPINAVDPSVPTLSFVPHLKIQSQPRIAKRLNNPTNITIMVNCLIEDCPAPPGYGIRSGQGCTLRPCGHNQQHFVCWNKYCSQTIQNSIVDPRYTSASTWRTSHGLCFYCPQCGANVEYVIEPARPDMRHPVPVRDMQYGGDARMRYLWDRNR
jgi:hypothetical protein